MDFVTFILVIVAIGFLYSCVLERLYAEPDIPDELHFIRTDDNVILTLHRYLPSQEKNHREIVLFCHGLGANKYNLDFDARYSLARYFSRNGYDSWVISLRGAPSRSIKQFVNGHGWHFNFDTFVEKDIPSAVKYILKKTGKQNLHWVGHSMGGMLLYAYLQRGGSDFVKSGVTLGSPVRFRNPAKNLVTLLRGERIIKNLTRINLGLIARMTAPITGAFRTSLLSYQMNTDNVDFKLIRRAQYNAVTPLSTRLLSQFRDWLEQDEFRTWDKTYSYKDNLAQIKTPILVIAGRDDRMAHVEDVKYAFNKLSSKNKKYLELSKDAGFSRDYGHIDMVFGREAPERVFPHILDWIENNI